MHIPWYATLFRGDKFEAALLEIAPHAVRYGATEWEIYRSKDDKYKFLQLATFADKADFESLLVRRRLQRLAGALLELVPGPRALRVARARRPRRPGGPAEVEA